MDLISLLGPLGKVIDIFSDARKKRNDRLERVRQSIDGYISGMKGHWDSISNGTFTVFKMHGDQVYYTIEMGEMTDSLQFWKFYRGRYWKERITEFLQSYGELQIEQATKEAYKSRHDLAVARAEAISAEIFHLIS